jgi:hypothetical protein
MRGVDQVGTDRKEHVEGPKDHWGHTIVCRVLIVSYSSFKGILIEGGLR